MKAKLGGKLLEGGMPDRLVVRIAAQGDGFHIVAGHRPRHPTQQDQAGNQAAQQRFLAHVAGELHKHPAAILEPGRKEVARLTVQFRFRERKLAHFAPVDLQQFAGQPFKADCHFGHPQRTRLPQRLDIVVKGAVAALVGMFRVTAHQFQHPPHTQVLFQPAFDRRVVHRNLADPLPRLALVVHRFAQNPADRIAMAADRFRNRTVAPAFLLQVVNR